MLEKLTQYIRGLLPNLAREPGSTTVHHPAPVAAQSLPQDDLQLDNLSRQFSSELFAQLIMELPSHRETLLNTKAAGDVRRLRDAVHQLLGAAAYCDAPDLETSLRVLRQTLKTGNHATIDSHFDGAMHEIDRILKYSGYRER